ncbi:O-acetyltransferase OatA [Hartmannibacter diazotrophicus]|uniref:O-acetyltransferase OatA n=1 Tax=Hartmannibacter diazotrophicus TaxID=1482074 RepID=A0A2C9D9R5_9HYPH|nr:acyltransferase family protein [Hartmannibacter diazotrophicus]SON57016.1 O-acetyltransferase OatA [Hartmannibacter diazotrophicus]
MKHRLEIDGLRAVAVVPVILFHAGVPAFSGGFVGVDVFFVISGYLITTLLVEDIEAGRFSLAAFYERRARRILPALFLVMAASVPFAWMWMLPEQMHDFAQSLLAVSLFGSNFLFWRQSGYFGAASEEQPFLHTWSLAVEEQYYLLFPLLLLFLWRFGRNRAFWMIAGGAFASLVLSEWMGRHSPSANFYLLPTRAWELFAGSIAAILLRRRRGVRGNEFLALSGLAAIVAPVFVYDETTPFPGVHALVPVLGVVLLILYAQRETLVARLLASRPFVGIGLISYSAYLWHQPLFAFARIRFPDRAGEPMLLGLAVLSLLLAAVTWRFVEQPFRSRSSPVLSRRGAVFAASAAGLLLFSVFGLAGIIRDGFAGRVPGAVVAALAAGQDRAGTQCNFDAAHPTPPNPVAGCLHVGASGRPLVVLLGDSHAMAISQEVTAQLLAAGFNVYAVSSSGCPPVPGLSISLKGDDGACPRFVAGVLDYAERAGAASLVLTARFPLYLSGRLFDNGEGGVEYGAPIVADVVGADVEGANLNGVAASGEADRRSRVLRRYEEGIMEMARRFHLVLVDPIPEAGWDVPNLVARRIMYGEGTAPLTTSLARYRERASDVLALFGRLASGSGRITVAPVYKALCDEGTGRCVDADGSGTYYFDDDHLSNAGARRIAPVIVEAVRRSLQALRRAPD